MRSRETRGFKWLGWVLLFVLASWGVGTVRAQEIGKTIDKSNVQEYKDLLAPVLYRAVQKGDWTLRTGNLSFPYRHSDDFLAESQKNEGKYGLGEKNWLVDKGTGKIPKHVYGMPFPTIDEKDPAIADKIIWNYTLMKYRFMGFINYTDLFWIAETGTDRSMGGNDRLIYYQGRPPGQIIKDNPENFSIGELSNLQYPMSLRGSNTLSWDYFDPRREITVFSYIPVIRRVRQTSGATRSDPYMGSDGWLDLNYMWAGKHSAMKWKLAGERTILVPFTTTNKLVVEEAPNGMITRNVQPVIYNFQTPGWKVGKGVAWAVPNLTWIPRKVWVVEQWPQDPFYNWGLHINYVDKETYVIWLKQVYTKGGEFRTWKNIFVHYSEAPSGKNNVMDYDSSTNIDEKVRHATTSTRNPKLKQYGYVPESVMGPKWFTVAKMLELTK